MEFFLLFWSHKGFFQSAHHPVGFLTEGESVVVYSINLQEILQNGHLEQNMELQDQDIIFIPRRFYSTFKEVIYALSIVTPWYYILRTFAP